jgi:hypothetical protein
MARLAMLVGKTYVGQPLIGSHPGSVEGSLQANKRRPLVEVEMRGDLPAKVISVTAER